jgi:hypothetical protein
MLNGTPHHKPYPLMSDLALAADDEVLAIDTDSRSFGPPIITAPNSFPALTHHNPETAIEPYTGIVPNSSSASITHASQHMGIPNTSSIRGIANEKRSGITVSSSSSTVALASAVPSHSESGATSTALPPIDYVPTQQQPYTIQRQFNLSRDQQMQNYQHQQHQQQYVMMQQQHLQQLQQQQPLSGDGTRGTVLPAIMQNPNVNGRNDNTGGKNMYYIYIYTCVCKYIKCIYIKGIKLVKLNNNKKFAFKGRTLKSMGISETTRESI